MIFEKCIDVFNDAKTVVRSVRLIQRLGSQSGSAIEETHAMISRVG